MGDLEKKRKKEEEATEGDEPPQHVPYPKSIAFIVGNEFCERFSYYGMKAILSIYLKKKLHFTEDKATVIYHTFSCFCYFTPIFGAMIADQFLGKFKTIVYISIIYVLGHLLKTLAAIPTLGVPPVEFSLLGLALIAIGTGGIKPCVSAFGGDQFKLPEQARQLQTFFSVFYFSINAGSLISTVLTPILREDVECFGDDTCYSLAFGVPAILMFVATLIIIMGKPLYKMVPPQGNMLSRVVGSIVYAIKKRINGESADHWLDTAKDEYEPQLVEDVKCVLRVLVLYLPLPVWWALFDQTGSRWTFQATRMNGVTLLGTIKPDQMQVINPLLILFLLPLFDRLVYPAFAKCGLLVKPLQRMTAGGILTALSFFISGFLELEMMKTYAKIPAVGSSHLHFMNNIPCHVSLQLSNATGLVHDEAIDALENMVLRDLEPGKYSLIMDVRPTCLDGILSKRTRQVDVMVHDEEVTAVFLGVNGNEVLPTVLDGYDDPEKDDGANGRLRIVSDISKTFDKSRNLTLMSPYDSVSFDLPESDVPYGSKYSKIDTGLYEIRLDDVQLGNITIAQGGVYSLIIAKDPQTNIHRSLTHTLTRPNSIHILWLIPQYFVITVGEIMFSVTGLEFSYSQAPESMKSVLQAAWLLTVAFGNIIVIIVAEAKAFDDQASEFFMFACLMLVDMGIFMGLAWRYTPRYVRSDREEGMQMKKGVNGVANKNFKNDTEL